MSGKTVYEKTQVDAFTSLVREGVYSENFDHAAAAQQFFGNVMLKALAMLGPQASGGLRVIDCGCGNGAWLDYLTDMDAAAHFGSIHGFDLTPEMVKVATRRLGTKVPLGNLQSGNILKSDSYLFPSSSGKFDLLYTYDVIQQLPSKLQFAAIEIMLDNLSEGGVAVIFDNDARSKYGRSMGRKKFLTRYFGLRLVPKYYCNASYPPLADFAERIVIDRALNVGIEISKTGKKRALIIQNNT